MRPSIGKYQSLKGCTALITGASRGIGAEFAFQLATHGVNLILTGRSLESLKGVRQQILSSTDVVVDIISADLKNSTAAQTIFDFAFSKQKRIDIFINNAGMGLSGHFLANDRDDYEKLLNVNVVAFTSLLSICIKHMISHRQRSYVINIGSLAGFSSNPNFPIYAASKAYVRHVSQCLSVQYRSSNLSITHVAPGAIDTRFSLNSNMSNSVEKSDQLLSPKVVVENSINGMLNNKLTVVPSKSALVKSFVLRIMPDALLIRLLKGVGSELD